MRSSLPSGKSATPPARCIHRPQRDTSSAEYRLLVSRASVGAPRELSSRRSPTLAPHTGAVSPTFRYGAFLFVALALADSWSARLTLSAANPPEMPPYQGCATNLPRGRGGGVSAQCEATAKKTEATRFRRVVILPRGLTALAKCERPRNRCRHRLFRRSFAAYSRQS